MPPKSKLLTHDSDFKLELETHTLNDKSNQSVCGIYVHSKTCKMLNIHLSLLIEPLFQHFFLILKNSKFLHQLNFL